MNFTEQNNKDEKVKHIIKIAIIITVILLFLVIAMMIYIFYQDSKELKLYVDRTKQPIASDLFIFNDNASQIYVSISDIAKLVGYEYYNGGYNTEEQNKCYVDNKNEVAGFEGGTNQLYKADSISNIREYDWYTLNEPVRVINNKLYATKESIEKAFNLVFIYDTAKNRIEIRTLPFLVSIYEQEAINYGYAGIDTEYKNQKTILQNMLPVKKSEGKKVEGKTIFKYGVITMDNRQILGPKYDKIEYIESLNDFYVTLDGKMGIMSNEGAQKIQPSYDEIKVMDNDLRLYYVKNSNACGVLDKDGQRVVYLEYNKIGIDATLFPNDDITNDKLLFDNCIPVMKNNKWGAFDINGEVVINTNYDSLGYVEGARKDSANYNTLLIQDIQGIIVCRDKKYGIINSTGKTIVTPVCDKIYGIKDLGVNKYYVEYNGETLELNQFLRTMVQSNGEIVGSDSNISTIENVTGPTNTNVYVNPDGNTQESGQQIQNNQ